MRLTGKRLPGVLLAAGIASAAVLSGPARAETASPFGVSPSLRRTGDGRTVLSVAFRIATNHFLYSERIAVTAKPGVLTPAALPAPKSKRDPETGETARMYDADVTLEYVLAGADGATANVEVRYQGCNDSLCFLPAAETFVIDTVSGAAARGPAPAGPPSEPPGDGDANWAEVTRGFRVAGRQVGYMGTRDFADFLTRALRGESPGDRLTSLFRRGAWLWGALWVVLGGLALNLTPCVLPMIPVTMALLGVGVAKSSRARGFLLGGVYGGAIALTYGALGAGVVLTGARFGTLNASPIFNAAVAAVFGLLSLAMFDAVSIDLSRFQRGPRSEGVSRRGPFAAAFVTGTVSALLAGACVAPVVISVLLFSADLWSRSGGIGLVLPFLLGLGMGLPWPFLGAGLSRLPRPGRWMTRVKYAFGVVILGFAGYYGHLAYTLRADRSPERRAAVAAAQAEATRGTWLTSLPRALDLARREGKPVLVDVWASWCKSCLAMERTTFRDPAFLAHTRDWVRVKVQAEDPRDPRTRGMLDALGVAGLPTYLVMRPETPAAQP